MDPVMLVLVPGILGGLIIASAFRLWQHRRGSAPSIVVPFHHDQPSTDVINMASIKVAGLGGAGLVAMAATVALDVPMIGQAVGIGLGAGILIAAAMIVSRREHGSMPSSGRRMGANTILSIDRPLAEDEGGDGFRAQCLVPGA